MPIRPILFEGEHYVGYLGRLLAFNGFRPATSSHAISHIKSLFPELANLTGQKRLTERIFCNVLEGDAKELNEKHSLLRLSQYVEQRCREAPADPLYSDNMRKGNGGYRFCKHCVAEDIGKHGFSYWKREHQIPGAEICTRHSSVLQESFFRAAALKFPEELVEHPRTIELSITPASLPQLLKYQRFLGEIINCTEQYSKEVLHQASVAKAFDIGYSSNALDHGELDQDIADSFGIEWLDRNAPRMTVSSPRSIILDPEGRILRICTKADSIYWGILLSFLFEDLRELSAYVSKSSIGEISARADEPGKRIYQKTLVKEYIKNAGEVSKIAEHFNIGVGTVKNQLKKNGLVPLTDISEVGAHREALFAFLVEKKDLEESARIGGISIESLLKLLRDTSQPMTNALNLMYTSAFFKDKSVPVSPNR